MPPAVSLAADTDSAGNPAPAAGRPWGSAAIAVDALACECGGRVAFVALVTEPESIAEILTAMKLAAKAPVPAPARSPMLRFEPDPLSPYDDG